jgi:hypothetical protein
MIGVEYARVTASLAAIKETLLLIAMIKMLVLSTAVLLKLPQKMEDAPTLNKIAAQEMRASTFSAVPHKDASTSP